MRKPKKKKIFLLILLALILFPVFRYFIIVIPPISGRTIDALTEKPIPGIKLNFVAEQEWVYFIQSKTIYLRDENYISNQDGEFRIPPSLHFTYKFPLGYFDGYEIIANVDNSRTFGLNHQILRDFPNDSYVVNHIPNKSYYPVALVSR